MNKYIELYCDDAPNDEKGGLSSILGNLLKSDVIRPLTLHIAKSFNSSVPLGRSAIRSWDFISHRGFSWHLLLRLPFILIDWLRSFFSLLIRPDAKEVQCLCVLVGADWTSLLRGLIVSKRIGAKHKSVYVVDNIFELSKRSSAHITPLVNIWITYLLKQFDRHLAITDGLSNALQTASGLKWEQLHLPYDFDVPIISKTKSLYNFKRKSRFELVFVGAVTPFVLPMVEELLELISNQNNAAPQLELHLLSRSFNQEFIDSNQRHLSLGKLRLFTGVSDMQMVARYFHTGVFVCPYSALLDHKKFVSQSFPSKLLKMLHTGIPSLILAPPYAAVYTSHGPFIATIDNCASHKELLSAIAKAENNLSTGIDGIRNMHNPVNFINMVSL